MKKSKIIITLILAIVLAIILPFVLPSTRKYIINNTTEVSSGLKTSGTFLGNFFGFFSSVNKLENQNKELSDKLSSLEVDRSKIEELEHENSLLKKELGFTQENQSLEMIPSKIVGKEPTNSLDYIIVDKGKNEGVKEEAAVISNGSLVGQVKEVYDNSAKIVLVTSKDSKILAILQESRAQGIMKGGLSGLILEDIVQDVNIKEGEYVITSGLDGKIPQGILIGRAGKLESSSSDLYKNVRVEQIVDFSKLEIVFIVK